MPITIATNNAPSTRPNLMKPQVIASIAKAGFSKLAAQDKTRMKFLRRYVGRHFGARQGTEAMPLAFMAQAVTTLIPNLVFKNPRVKITSRFLPYREYASIGALALDHLIDEIDLKTVLRKLVLDAIFGDAFIKIGLCTAGSAVNADGAMHDVGQPYVDRVDLSDMLIDPMARAWDECRILGNRFVADSEELADLGTIDPDKIKKLSTRYRETGGDKLSAAGLFGHSGMHGDVGGAIDATQPVDLVDVYIPRHNAVVTMPWASGGEVEPEILAEVPYEGPESGMYHKLGFAPVPDNVTSLPLAALWYDLDVMGNKIARKAAERAEREKSILAYESAAFDDAQEIFDAMDGQGVRVDNIDAIKEVSFGGVTADNYQFMAWVQQQFSDIAMNMDLLSGQGSNEPTATQAEMVQQNTTVRLGDMQNMIYEFTETIAKHLFFYLHTDPLIELPLAKRVAGVDEQVFYTPEMREGDWLDYNIKIRPYSMARQEPNIRIRRIMELTSSVIPALASAFQMLGPAFNLENTLNILAREMDIEELDEIINSQVLHMQVARMQQMLEMGIPVDAKVIQTILGVQGGVQAGGGAAPGGVRPDQPNPMQQMSAGISPPVETNMMRQDTASELQRAY